MEGIGDTLRVSLTADPVQEVRAGIAILEACGLRNAEPELISCPTCGRTKINLTDIASEISDFLENLKSSGKKIQLAKVAVMGCIVNGPGEASHADIGLAGGDGKAAVFRHGKVIATLPEREAVAFLKQEILASSK
jgi:(E)-4-hydroxy-3-methylbut-2-enyl-diphosphate synthase